MLIRYGDCGYFLDVFGECALDAKCGVGRMVKIMSQNYKENDWVVLNDKSVVKILMVSNEAYTFSLNTVENPKGKIFAYDLGGDYWYDYNKIERHATLNEIKQEKERRWWGKHGRDVWELKRDDILIDSMGILDRVICVYDNGLIELINKKDKLKIDELKKRYKVVCFKEQRLDKVK